MIPSSCGGTVKNVNGRRSRYLKWQLQHANTKFRFEASRQAQQFAERLN